jgi:hypothetical protein
MHKLHLAALLLIMIFVFSCEKQGIFVNCSDCVEDEPVTAELQADLDPDYFYGAVVEIWEGYLEDSISVGKVTVYRKSFTQTVVLNKKYTITATYWVDNTQYIAVDSATPRVRYDKSQCENPCYFVYDRKCNLKLKL